MSKWLVGILKASLIIIGIAILLLCIYWLPAMAERSVELFPEVAYLKYPILIGIYLTCIPFYLAIYESFKLLVLIGKDNVFTQDACKSLRVVSFSSIAVSVLYVIGLVILMVENAMPPGLFLLGIAIIFACIIIAIFTGVLKVLLNKMVEIKKENDFTV